MDNKVQLMVQGPQKFVGQISNIKQIIMCNFPILYVFESYKVKWQLYIIFGCAFYFCDIWLIYSNVIYKTV
jgi:hypothetical protein